LDDVCPNIKCSLPAVCCCCNENKPCPQHPMTCTSQFSPDQGGFCPPENNQEPELEECPPQEPITVHIQPCCVTMTEGKNHKCAPDAHTCNDGQKEYGAAALLKEAGGCGSGGCATVTPCA
jgi:hypothetical protein